MVSGQPVQQAVGKMLTPEGWRGCVIIPKVMVRNYAVNFLGHGKVLSGLANFLNCSHSMGPPEQCQRTVMVMLSWYPELSWY